MVIHILQETSQIRKYPESTKPLNIKGVHSFQTHEIYKTCLYKGVYLSEYKHRSFLFHNVLKNSISQFSCAKFSQYLSASLKTSFIRAMVIRGS